MNNYTDNHGTVSTEHAAEKTIPPLDLVVIVIEENAFFFPRGIVGFHN